MSEYYVGLDIGTSSIGWAVTDTNYKLQKFNGKTMWGVRLFDEAQKAEERRIFRASRRRLQRRKQRIEWLQNVFKDLIGQVDPGFFQRMKESYFWLEDKQLDNGQQTKYVFFADKNFTDSDYYKRFPTIYHLRNALMHESSPFDIRLVYIALHHIFKYRGHFLSDADAKAFKASSLADFSTNIQKVNEYLDDAFSDGRCLSVDNVDDLLVILTDQSLSASARFDKICERFPVEKTMEGVRQIKVIFKLLCGLTVKLEDIFDNELLQDGEIKKLDFKSDFSDQEEVLRSQLGDDYFLIDVLKQIYDFVIVRKLLSEGNTLSEAKISLYEKHKNDLKRLKQVIKEHCPDKYREVFKAKDKVDNYPAYSGHESENYRCNYEKFRLFLTKKIFKGLENIPEITQMISELNLERFLPKQTTKENSTIPHQLHELELEAILNNAARYIPLLNEKRGDLSVKEQIIQMFKFRIDYFVGPLNPKSENAWAVHRNTEKITPWNYDSVIDLDKSAEYFIRNMTAKCSYLGEDVLPQNSLLFTKYHVLNSINKIKVNGYPISVEDKQNIYRYFEKTGKKISPRTVRDFLLSCGLLNQSDEIGGLDDELKADLKIFKTMREILGETFDEKMAENIILHLTLFAESPKQVHSWLKSAYGKSLTEDQIKQLSRLRIKGWGRLSSEFLTKIEAVDEQTGEVTNIIGALWETNNNLMELLSPRYGFSNAIQLYKQEKFGSQKMTLSQYLDEAYVSPGVKRSIYQSLEIVDEVQKVMGKVPPKKIFVEVTREEGEKRRTKSRKKNLEELYKSLSSPEVQAIRSYLAQCDEQMIRKEKLYLYFLQLGRCMYSNERIDIVDLESKYDVDHIYPQSKVKDDSLDNKVLVRREENGKKGDVYPLLDSVQDRMKAHWSYLLQVGLLTKKKYERLIRRTPLSDEELADFIARQVVETSQSAKVVADLLKRKFSGKTDVVYCRARHVTDFRKDQVIDKNGEQKHIDQCVHRNFVREQDPLFVKNRLVNDLHHAKDAYLNIVVGNVYDTKFTKNPLHYIKQQGLKFTRNKLFVKDIPGAWIAKGDESINIVRSMMRKNNVLFTRKTFERSGAFFDVTIMPKGKGQRQIKAHDARYDIKKYGGYNKAKGAYFCFVSHEEKKKRKYSVETVFLMYKSLYEKDPVRYCEEILGLSSPVVLVPKIKMNTLFSIDGALLHLSGRSEDRLIFNNATQLSIDPQWHVYIKHLELCSKNDTVTTSSRIASDRNEIFFKVLLQKLTTNAYSKALETFSERMVGTEKIFASLTLEEQVQTLLQFLSIFACRATTVDISSLRINGKSPKQSRIRRNNTVTESKRFVLINQSVTGLFEKELSLNALMTK